MPAYLEYSRSMRPRERALALAAVVLVQLVLGFALLTGLRVQISRAVDGVQQLVQVNLSKPPPPTRPETRRTQDRRPEAAPKAEPKPVGGSPGPKPAHAPPSVTPVVAVQPTVAPPGGGTGTGPALGSGSGGGTGGYGYGDAGGGSDAEQIAGAIHPSDYPRNLRRAGIGGTVLFVFTIGANGRVTRCGVTRSSSVPELDTLTCRLVMQRFVYRPSTDRNGRPVPTEADGEHEWIARRY